MATLRLNQVGFAFPTGELALDNISLEIPQGQFVLLCGRSGSGKSTLLRLIQGDLAQRGVFQGEMSLNGTPISNLDRRDRVGRIAYVGQNPDGQLVTDRVWHELAFGLENLGLPRAQIRRKVAEIASFFGIQSWFHKQVEQLSGGQQQILALAAAMVMEPDILLLDEPTSQLDPLAAEALLGAVSRLNRELGITVLLSEHRLDQIFPIVDQVLVLDRGHILCQGAPPQITPGLHDLRHPMFSAMPTAARVWTAVEGGTESPISVREGRSWLENWATRHTFSPCPAPIQTPTGESAVELGDVCFRYEQDGADVLRNLNLTVQRGQIYAILGGNGTGKTTALSVICNLIRPQRGKVEVNGKIALLPQDPRLLFQHPTVARELEGADQSTLDSFAHLLTRHPFDLSGGETQGVALAKLLAPNPDILLLDEPTKGLDAEHKAQLGKLLKRLSQAGVTVILVSHDLEFCARVAHMCALFFHGDIVSQASPQEFFTQTQTYTTAAARMARDLIPGAITAEDIVLACGARPVEFTDNTPPPPPVIEKRTPPSNPEKKQISRRNLLMSLVLFLSLPLTLWTGFYLLEDRAYLLISLILMAQIFIAAVLLFEGGRPRARELGFLAALTALAVLGRAAFAPIPQFQPMTAIVIVSAVALGGKSGFLIGAMTMLTSNLLFGQGPWTPFQMLALALVGLLAGLLFHGRRRGRILLCLYGGAATYILYGGITNLSFVLTFQPEPTWQMMVSAMVLAFPFDVIHTVSTIIFLALLTSPLLRKLERVQTKYGVFG